MIALPAAIPPPVPYKRSEPWSKTVLVILSVFGVMGLIALIMKVEPRILIAAVLLGIYFAPTALAHKKQNSTAIFLLNLLLGWTFIGWVVALVWAATKDAKR